MSNKGSMGGAAGFEFLILFPFIVAILYAAAYYSIVFSWQYRMQNVLDRSVAEALYFDRSQLGVDADASDEEIREAITKEMVERAQQRVDALAPLGLPDGVAAAVMSEGEACEVVDGSVVRCRLLLSAEAITGLLPSVGFGFLGDFPPPPPNGVAASAQAAF